MFDIVTAFLGPRVCPWCTGRNAATYDWFYDRLPKRVHVLIGKSGYDSWVGRVGGGWHHRHHVQEAGRITDHVD